MEKLSAEAGKLFLIVLIPPPYFVQDKFTHYLTLPLLQYIFQTEGQTGDPLVVINRSESIVKNWREAPWFIPIKQTKEGIP